MEEENPDFHDSDENESSLHIRRLRTRGTELGQTHATEEQSDLPPEVMVHLGVVNHLVELTGSEKRPSLRLAALWLMYSLGMASPKTQSTSKAALQLGLMEKLRDVFDPGWDGRPLHRRMESVLLLMALAMLCRLSSLHVRFIRQITSLPLLRQLVTIADVDGKYFVYPSEAATLLKDLDSQARNLVAQVVERDLTTEEMEKLQEDVGDHLAPAVCVGGKIKVCDLFNPEDPDFDVRQELIGKSYVWPKLYPIVPGQTSSNVRNNEEERLFSEDLSWHPIFITSVLNGRLFWAHVGMNTFKKLDELFGKLREAAESALELAVEVQPGRMVLVKSKTSGCPLVRAQVLECRQGQITLFTVDFGHLQVVPHTQVFSCPASLSLQTVPPLATFCCLPDVQAPPVDADQLQLALCILANLVRGSLEVAQALFEMGLLELTMRLLSAPDFAVGIQAARVLQNMSSSRLTGDAQSIITVMERCLDVLKMIPELGLSKTAAEKMEAPLLCTLCNIVLRNNALRDHFYKSGGLEVTVQCMQGKNVGAASYVSGLRVLRNMIHEASVFGPPSSSSKRSARAEREQSAGVEEEVPGMTAAQRQQAEDQGAGEEQRLPFPADGSRQARAGIVQSWLEEIALQDDQQVPQPLKIDFKMVKGDKFPYEEGTTVHLCSQLQSSEISRSEVAMVVCSMLNTGLGGTIVCGIKDGVIEGIAMNREERDQIRLGVDMLFFRDIEPSVLHTDIKLSYLPVFHLDRKSGQLVQVTNTEIAVITFAPNSGTFYMCPGNSSFYRIGARSECLHLQEVRQLVGSLEERKFLGEIEELSAQLKDLQKLGGYP